MLNTTDLNNGIHVIAVRAVDDQGASRVIGRRFVQTFNTGSNLPPFGGIDWPIADHVMYADGCEEIGGEPPPWSGEEYDDPDNVEMVIGWVLDVGSRTDFGGVGYVQLLLDGNIIADTFEGSFYYEPLDYDFNYLGHYRMDIAELYFDVPNAKDAGFAFLMDINYLILARGYTEGLHYLKVRAGDLENNVTDIAQIPVIFDCNNDWDDPSWGDIVTPAHMERDSGIVEVTGFAVDTRTIVAVEIWVDGVYIGDADEINLPSDWVEEQYPWLPTGLTRNKGFSYEMDTIAAGMADGEKSLVVWTEDTRGGRNVLGERRFVLDNQSP
jgi:hypothetical protein